MQHILFKKKSKYFIKINIYKFILFNEYFKFFCYYEKLEIFITNQICHDLLISIIVILIANLISKKNLYRPEIMFVILLNH